MQNITFYSVWNLPRNAAKRSCSDYGGMRCTVYGDSDDDDMSVQIRDSMNNDGVYGMAVSLADAEEIQNVLQNASDSGVHIHSFNSGMDEYEQYHSELHVGQDEYAAGYRGWCCTYSHSATYSNILYINLQHVHA